jgi:hypothetical protein
MSDTVFDRMRPMEKKEAPPVDPNIALAAKVKETYCQYRSRLEVLRNRPATYHPPRRYDGVPATVERKAVPSVWLSLCEWAEKEKIDIVAYTRFQLRVISKSANIPEPLQMKSHPRLMYFKKNYHPDMFLVGVQTALNIQLQALKTGIIVRQTYEKLGFIASHVGALTDSALEISPLVRYCVAYSIRDKHKAFRIICKRNRRAAKKQLAVDFEDYVRSSFVKWIPEKLLRRPSNG